MRYRTQKWNTAPEDRNTGAINFVNRLVGAEIGKDSRGESLIDLKLVG